MDKKNNAKLLYFRNVVIPMSQATKEIEQGVLQFFSNKDIIDIGGLSLYLPALHITQKGKTTPPLQQVLDRLNRPAQVGIELHEFLIEKRNINVFGNV